MAIAEVTAGHATELVSSLWLAPRPAPRQQAGTFRLGVQLAGSALESPWEKLPVLWLNQRVRGPGPEGGPSKAQHSQGGIASPHSSLLKAQRTKS